MVKTYRLKHNLFETELELTNTSGSAMPAGFGIHPYFVQNVLDSPDVLLQFEARGWYATDQSLIPSGAMQAVPPHLNFAVPRSPKQQDLNEVYGGYGGWAELTWPGVARLRLESDPIFEHLVLYTPPDGSLALEPVTNATNGFNLFARGVKGTGVVVLEPSQSMRGNIRIKIDLLSEPQSSASPCKSGCSVGPNPMLPSTLSPTPLPSNLKSSL
jgi:aldose 1-epimerase